MLFEDFGVADVAALTSRHLGCQGGGSVGLKLVLAPCTTSTSTP
jgi:hypothetical protein